MDMKHNENRLVPGQGRPLNLDGLKRLTAGKPLEAAIASSQASGRPRRFRRTGRNWSGAMVLGAFLAATGAVVLFKDVPPDVLVRGPAAPALPDEGLSPEEQARYWAMASDESSRFPALMGVHSGDKGEEARMEENARKLERLLSDREHPGLR